MIKYIRLMLEYDTYCVWLYDENNEIIDNDNPPELKDDKELTDAFMAVSDLYDTFFVDDEKQFRYVGCPDEETKTKLISLINTALSILEDKTNNKYSIVNDIKLDF